jgi:excisionase family DNA binding protein
MGLEETIRETVASVVREEIGRFLADFLPAKGDAVFTKSEVARHLKVSESTIGRWMRLQNDPIPRTKGGHPRFLQSEVDRWLERRNSYL